MDQRLFGEDGARILIAYRPEKAEEVRKHAAEAGVPVTELGTTGGSSLCIEGVLDVDVAHLREAWNNGFEEGVGL